MDLKLPIKRLLRLNWLLAVIVSIIVYATFTEETSHGHQLLFTVETFVCISLSGHASVVIMQLLSRRFVVEKRKFNRFRLLFSYPASILIYLLLWPVFAEFSGQPWSFGNVKAILALTGGAIVVNTMVYVLHNSVLLYQHKLFSDLELSKLRASNAEATNLLLKQQVQPHFLFNAITTLKALYHKDTDVADKYIVHMANFLRASISHQATKVASLEEELSLLLDYFEMQKIRFGSALECYITLPEESLKKYCLPSFSLQPLLENAIKHNEFTLDAPLRVEIYKNGNWLHVSNNLQQKNIKSLSANFGLANLSERYRLLSQDEIIITESGGKFEIAIKLLNNDYRNY